MALGGPGLVDRAGTAQMLYELNESAWSVGALFFGLWLLPMGRLVLGSGWMPRALGWLLVVGGAGYVLSAILDRLAPDATVAVGLLSVPATIGEFWMIGYLLVRGVAPTAATVRGGPRPGSDR